MKETFITGDGSVTIYMADLKESYHSRHGAVSESKHVFIEAGLKEAFLRFGLKLNILEIGFGTGLNALLTFQEARKHRLQVWYTALELNPVSPDLLKPLNYGITTGYPADDSVFERMHDTPYNVAAEISEDFVLEKRLTDVRDFSDSPYRYHLVYFDAFAPRVQPELWTEEVFSRIMAAMAPNGVLVTYSAKSDVQRALKSVGFDVQKISGPPGKREMIRASAHNGLKAL